MRVTLGGPTSIYKLWGYFFLIFALIKWGCLPSPPLPQPLPPIGNMLGNTLGKEKNKKSNLAPPSPRGKKKP